MHEWIERDGRGKRGRAREMVGREIGRVGVMWELRG
jgi:hypothetical protein